MPCLAVRIAFLVALEAPGGGMSSTAEPIGAAAALLGLGLLTLRGARGITRRRPFGVEWEKPGEPGEPAEGEREGREDAGSREEGRRGAG
ncbi:hypothetical protein STXM2123_2247 [Streptomyces sp. F-3]|nr:hypothetical protein STXM2123_2247 [Streptomyces sp. F-3]